MGKEYTEAQKRASLKYQQSKSQIKLTVSPEQHEAYRSHAKAKNITLSKLIVSLLDEDMAKTDMNKN